MHTLCLQRSMQLEVTLSSYDNCLYKNLGVGCDFSSQPVLSALKSLTNLTRFTLRNAKLNHQVMHESLCASPMMSPYSFYDVKTLESWVFFILQSFWIASSC